MRIGATIVDKLGSAQIVVIGKQVDCWVECKSSCQTSCTYIQNSLAFKMVHVLKHSFLIRICPHVSHLEKSYRESPQFSYCPCLSLYKITNICAQPLQNSQSFLSSTSHNYNEQFPQDGVYQRTLPHEKVSHLEEQFSHQQTILRESIKRMIE